MKSDIRIEVASPSSIPSSQSAMDDSATGQPGAKGKGMKQNDARSGNTRTVETVQIAEVN
ncbi:MAG: hypothetical protein GY815_10930, partial [Gammaproteobacteria bacterium]|nr:hypothetical protein [Gammaproteobacteria bacterium]